MGRKVPNRVKTEVRNAQNGRCLCGVQSHFIYLDIADDAWGTIEADEVVMLCRACARSKTKEQLRDAKKMGIIYIDSSSIKTRTVRLLPGQTLKRPVWHKYIVGGPIPNPAFRKVRTKHGMFVAEDRKEEVEQAIDEVIEWRKHVRGQTLVAK